MPENLLEDVDDRLTFEQYAVSENWVGGVDDDGVPVLSTTVETVLGVPYELEFNLASNLAADVESVRVEVIFGGESVGSFTHVGGVFETYTFELAGAGEAQNLEFRITSVLGGDQGSIDTSGVVPSYEKAMTFGGNEVTVDAFAPGQSHVYQVLNGQLVVFDLETNSYTEAEVPRAVNVNAIGYSQEDDLIYGIARSNGFDANGSEILKNDVIAMDARGATYAVSSGIMGSYIGDVDDQGNLWTFSGNLGQAVVYDLSEVDANGALTYSVLSLPSLDFSTSGLADLAYHGPSQTFFGLAHSGVAGQDGTFVSIDISEVALGGDPIVTTRAVTGTLVEGDMQSGIPVSAFGATMVDADGNVYIGANNADHDLDVTTLKTGGFYKITEVENGSLALELLADAPRVSSNDGALDTRGVDPFLGIDTSSSVLLRAPVLSVALAEDDLVKLAAKGAGVTLDLLANDDVGAGDSLSLSHINGIAVSVGQEFALSNGEVVTYLGNGQVHILPGSPTRDVTAELTYSIVNESGTSDTGTLTIETSPVQGTAGNDHIVGFTDADGTQVDGTDGANEVILGYGGNDKIYAGAGDDDIFGGAGRDFIRAQDGDDLVHGDDGNDILDGGRGADHLFGGAGNDTYFVDNAEDVVSEEGGDGTDTVKSKVDFVLGAGLENLWLDKGSTAINGAGNELRNMIVGNELGNLLTGMAGNDNIIAGAGDDTIYGGANHDKLHGGDGADLLYGDDGNDKLHGGSGNDTVFGGNGNDILCPGLGDDVMYGGVGNDLLSGNAGADIAYGGLGNDTYKVSDAFDTIVEFAGEGHDVVHAKADFALSEHVEDLVFFGTQDFAGAGNDGNNRITGNVGDDTMTSGGGDDHVDGGAGADVLSGDHGKDKLLGRIGDDHLSGGAGADTLSGGEGADVLSGGAGSDFLAGDAGADIFEFKVGDGHDLLLDFDTVEDTLHLIGVAEEDLSWVEIRGSVELSYGLQDCIFMNGLTVEEIDAINVTFL
ncbi:calcium-binding protein [Shimia sp.]|uniref:calcium-binding protein n=1 Tax=Shimia sp. TaxID=1954381 RepID=UPI003297D65F